MSSSDEASKRPRFLTIEQVAEELNVGLPTVRMLLKYGELRGTQIGGRGYLAHL
ncbi:excisionase family DNA-binding protein [Arthrobacter sp. H16F315]|uniref:excisionase family DNA-binding protein n=1 Tax=Arthrobacter sp. H16F315 TaxID=2955314 RepID=UPI00315966C4